MIYQNIFLNKSLILFSLLGVGEGQIMPWGGDGDNAQIYTRKAVLLCMSNRYKIFWKKSFFNHFHNPHFAHAEPQRDQKPVQFY